MTENAKNILLEKLEKEYNEYRQNLQELYPGNKITNDIYCKLISLVQNDNIYLQSPKEQKDRIKKIIEDYFSKEDDIPKLLKLYPDELQYNQMKDLEFRNSPEKVKDRVEQFKEAITTDRGMDENVKTVVKAIIDTIVNEDGEFTKGTVVILSSAATVIEKMLTLSKGEEGNDVSLDNIDTQDLMMKMSSDLVNFAIISFAVIGEDTKEGKIIYDTINNLIGLSNNK